MCGGSCQAGGDERVSDRRDILTIDVEEWFHGHNYLAHVPPAVWDEQESRVVANTQHCLDLLAKHGVRATFFVLGWVAERQPELIRQIAAAGHEIGCHSYAHPVVFQLTEDEFLADLSHGLSALAAAGISTCRLYRAPSFSITRKVHNFLPLLADHGIDVDSSLFPIHHPRYGQPRAPRLPFRLELQQDRELVVVPMTTVRAGWLNFPFSGGGYLRLAPLTVYQRLARRAHRQGVPVMIYLHPWELDSYRPDVGMSWLSRWRSQGGQNRMPAKLEEILVGGNFQTLGEYVDSRLAAGDLPRFQLPLY
jgi:polysaccharide deacetylase family protein (PEP-CTERM system associated)